MKTVPLTQGMTSFQNFSFQILKGKEKYPSLRPAGGISLMKGEIPDKY
ncbi:MAG: hypothetical protein RIG77_04095 [Cyclobacteriaceae bacterium]